MPDQLKDDREVRSGLGRRGALGALGALLALSLVIVGCRGPQATAPAPSASAVMDQCQLSGAGKDPNPYAGGAAPPAYLVVCMRASGWVMLPGNACEGDTRVVDGSFARPPTFDDPACYSRSADAEAK